MCCLQGGFNSPAPNPPPTLPASLTAAFAATNVNVTGFDNGTLLTVTNAPATPPDEAPPASGAGNSTSWPLIQTELLSLPVKPDFLVPLKVVAGISSSFITNLVQPDSRIGRELTGTETLK